MITAFELVALTGVSVIGPDPDALTPESVPIIVEVQLNTAVATVDAGVKFNGVALQIS
jgi:hypothetical protein